MATTGTGPATQDFSGALSAFQRCLPYYRYSNAEWLLEIWRTTQREKIAIKKHKRSKKVPLVSLSRWVETDKTGVFARCGPFSSIAAPPPSPLPAKFSLRDSRCCFLDSGPGRPCFGWWVVLCWHLRQEFPGKIVQSSFGATGRGSKGV